MAWSNYASLSFRRKQLQTKSAKLSLDNTFYSYNSVALNREAKYWKISLKGDYFSWSRGGQLFGEGKCAFPFYRQGWNSRQDVNLRNTSSSLSWEEASMEALKPFWMSTPEICNLKLQLTAVLQP